MIETLSLFRPLNDKLISLLVSLSPADWNKKTVAGSWTVKDVAAHLLDGSIRSISSYRDRMEPKTDIGTNTYAEVVSYLNQLNAEWVKAMKRVSPTILVEWLKTSHEDFISALEQLDLNSPAKISVAWAGDEVSPNWFHIAREYTEKWHHQQQIREAVNDQAILTRKFYQPVLATFMKALPYKFKDIPAPTETRIRISIDSAAGGTWFLEKQKTDWTLHDHLAGDCQVVITIPAELSWKLFTKAVRYTEVRKDISIQGEKRLALPVLEMVTVMA